MFYKTHQIEQLHKNETIIFENNTWTVYNSNFQIIAVYKMAFTKNMVISGAQRIA